MKRLGGSEIDARTIAENVRRLMAQQTLTIAQLASRSGLDRRTVQGILRASKRPQMRTLGKLAKGLGVPIEELFVPPEQLVYRAVSKISDPRIECLMRQHPELFQDWSPADYLMLEKALQKLPKITEGELFQVVLRTAQHRRVHRQVEELLESRYRDIVCDLVGVLYQRLQAEKPPG